MMTSVVLRGSAWARAEVAAVRPIATVATRVRRDVLLEEGEDGISGGGRELKLGKIK